MLCKSAEIQWSEAGLHTAALTLTDTYTEGRCHTNYMQDRSYGQGCTREARDVRGQVTGQPDKTMTREG